MNYIKTYELINDEFIPILIIENDIDSLNNTVIIETNEGLVVFYTDGITKSFVKDNKRYNHYTIKKEAVYRDYVEDNKKLKGEVDKNASFINELKNQILSLEQENYKLKTKIIDTQCEKIEAVLKGGVI